MIVALLLGRKGSTGFPGKNLYPVLGKPLATYPMMAAKNSAFIDKVYLSTDDEGLIELAHSLEVDVINRPAHLCTSEALGEDAYVHGYHEIKDRNPNQNIDIIVLLFCNAATITSSAIDEGITRLRGMPECDSVVTVSRYNMWSPLRARKENQEGFLEPFIPFEYFGNPDELNCDRDSQGDVLFADMGASIVKSHCLENIDQGLLPQKWMGKKIYPLRQEAGFDVDYEWQIPVLEWWLKKYGIQ
jgi:CMP-N-acetylneuraminic acid synthetase